MNNTVYIKKCNIYNESLIKTSLDEIFSEMSISSDFISKGDKVVIKPNLLIGKKPEQVVTTHPLVIKKVIDYLKKYECKVIIGDSPGGPFTKKRLKSIYKKCGFLEFEKIDNVELNYDTSFSKVSFQDGLLIKSFQIANFIKDADLIINMPKLKTHSFMKYTGAVKNLFGAIPGMKKAEYHLRLPEVDNFALMLVDLASLLKPNLNIMDAVIGMDGDGPSSGRKKEIGYILVSKSPFSLDLAGATLLNIKPEKIPTIYQAIKNNISLRYDEINLKGDELKPALNTKIPKISRSDTTSIKGLPVFITNIINKLLKPRPIFKQDTCVKCGECKLNCPSDAITLDEYPKVDLDKCIRCYCCQELCSYNAVKIHRPLLGKLLFK
ncbi:MAG: DUF362 domain-containing protein [Halanaerobiales bacterium]|nr:DUF362 domain-containing protein [Halanaerobiales bacterium]